MTAVVSALKTAFARLVPVAPSPRGVASVLIEPLEGRRLLAVLINSFIQNTLVSSSEEIPALEVDANLRNPWGLSIDPESRSVWLADNAQGAATGYTARGVRVGRLVHIPPGINSVGDASPTGIVLNRTRRFVIANDDTGAAAASQFVFVTQDGTIAGYDPEVDINNAITVVDNSDTTAVYTGAAMASLGGKPYLYVANFSDGRVDIYDANFKPVRRARAFVDPDIPSGFAPFNIQNISNKLYVTYAWQNEEGDADQRGAGNGYVNVFGADGRFIRRFISNGALNSPWGIVRAPDKFGPFARHFLIGNRGDGRINIFRPNGAFVGSLLDRSGRPIEVENLWGLQFGTGTGGVGKQTTLFYSGGPNGQSDGVFGTIVPNRPGKSPFATRLLGLAGD